jgi:hypothetical protein
VRPDSLFEDLELKDGEKWKLFKGREARKDLAFQGEGSKKRLTQMGTVQDVPKVARKRAVLQ